MLVPGMVFSGAGSVDITAGAATTPAFFNEGVGFMADRSLAVDTDAPAGNIWRAGMRQSAAGALYGTVTSDPTDVFLEGGIRVSAIGQLIYEAAAAAAFNNGNPVAASGLFAVN